MSENIKPNATGVFYNTTIPSLADNANIQQALRMYHYGISDGTIPEDVGDIDSESIAAYLGGLQTQIDALDYGSSYSATEPAEVENGYVWIDANSNAPIINSGIAAVAQYQNDAPTSGLVDGMLWVDKNSSPLTMYVYDAAEEEWKEIGA